MAVTDSSVSASAGGPRRSAVLVAVLAVAAGAPAARFAGGGVSRDGGSREEAAGAGRRRSSRRGRIGGADRTSVVDGGYGVCLRRCDQSTVNQLLLSVNDDLLTGLEVGAVGEHGAGADGEIHVDENDVGVERLTRLLSVATLFFARLLVAGGGLRSAMALGGRRGGIGGSAAGEVLQLIWWCGAGVDDEDVVALIAVLDGSGGNDDGTRALAEDEANVDELVGEKRAILVVEDGLELRGSGGGVNLIVDCEQRAARDFVRVGAVVGFDDELLTTLHRLLYLRELILRQREDDGD